MTYVHNPATDWSYPTFYLRCRTDRMAWAMYLDEVEPLEALHRPYRAREHAFMLPGELAAYRRTAKTLLRASC